MYILVNAFTNTTKNSEMKEHGSWSKENDNTIVSLSITDSKEYFDLVVKDDFDTSKKAYLVYAEYSRGDSFGYENGCLEYLKLFNNENEAIAFSKDIKLLEEYAHSNYEDETKKPQLFEMLTNDKYERNFSYFGETFTLPWGGWFERVTLIDVKELSFTEYIDTI